MLKYLILLPLLLTSLSLGALPVELEEARDVHYGSLNDRAERALRGLEGLRTQSASDNNGVLPLISYYEGLLLLDLGKETEAASAWERGMGEAADDPLLRARIQSRWMLLQKTAVIIRSGSEIQDICDAVLADNPREFYALIMSAQGLVNAPPLFGGDPAAAVRMLESARSLAENDYELFDLELVLADAYRRQKQWAPAAEACLRALGLFPGNQAAAALQEAVEKRKRK